MLIWKLLKDYVREFEIANNVQFSNDAWQRVKRLEKDIYASMHDDDLPPDVPIGESPSISAEEAEIEEKAALVTEFSNTCKLMIDLIDDLAADDILPTKTPTDRAFWDALRDSIGTAHYQFDPDLDDHSREE